MIRMTGKSTCYLTGSPMDVVKNVIVFIPEKTAVVKIVRKDTLTGFTLAQSSKNLKNTG